MNDTNGWRAVGAGAADWKINRRRPFSKATSSTSTRPSATAAAINCSAERRCPTSTRSTAPPCWAISRGAQPDTYDIFNTSARLDYTFSPSWLRFAAASLSHSLIQDNVLYAYGCYYEAECNNGTAPDVLLRARRNLRCLRLPRPRRAAHRRGSRSHGRRATSRPAQSRRTSTAGGELFLRSVQQPGFYTVQNPYDPSGVVQDGAVYTYVGSENIYQPIATLPPPGDPNSLEDPLESAGPRRLWEDRPPGCWQ